MAAKSDFSVEEWRTLRDAPYLLALAVAMAGGSGIFGGLKEAMAPAGLLVEALQGNNALLRDIAADAEIRAAVEDLEQLARSLGEFGRTRDHFRGMAIARAGEALAILRRAAPAEDVAAYGDFLRKLGDRVANAAKEGDFLGFGGERVSEPERLLLAELARATGFGPGASR